MEKVRLQGVLRGVSGSRISSAAPSGSPSKTRSLVELSPSKAILCCSNGLSITSKRIYNSHHHDLRSDWGFQETTSSGT